MAIVSSETPEGALPPVVALGARTDGDIRWFLAFEGPWKNQGSIESAFLVLDPAPGDGSVDDIDVDVWTVHDAWQSGAPKWRRGPTFGHPGATGLARSRPSAPLRIDVTRIARQLATRSPDHGLVIVARRMRGHGAPYFTGLQGGLPPRFEVYLR
jgi:hypothetical protein